MIACGKSRRNDRHRSGLVHSATGGAGYSTSGALSMPLRLGLVFVTNAATRWIYPAQAPSPEAAVDLLKRGELITVAKIYKPAW